MSKSVGNVIDPWEILGTRGADPLRWWMFSQGSPWTPTRVSLAAIDASMRETLLTLVEHPQLLHHLRLAERVRPRRPGGARRRRSAGPRPLGAVAAGLHGGRGDRRPSTPTSPWRPPRPWPSLVDDLSNWYVRRSRRRFWRTDPDAPPADSLAAQATLHAVLVTVVGAARPVLPVRGRPACGGSSPAPPTDDSVHLADWPERSSGRPRRTGAPRRRRGGRRPSTPTSRPRWRWPAGSPRSAGRPAARPGCRSASPWPGPWSSCPRGPAPPRRRGGGRAQRGRGGGGRGAGRGPPVRAGAQLQGARAPPGRGGEGGAGRPWTRWTRRRPPPRSRRGDRSPSTCPAGPVELGPGDVELRVRGQAGFAGLAGGGRGGGPRPAPRRRPAPARAGPRGGPPRPGPAQGERARGVRPHPPPPGRGWTTWSRWSSRSPARSWPPRWSSGPGTGEGTALDLDGGGRGPGLGRSGSEGPGPPTGGSAALRPPPQIGPSPRSLRSAVSRASRSVGVEGGHQVALEAPRGARPSPGGAPRTPSG